MNRRLALAAMLACMVAAHPIAAHALTPEEQRAMIAAHNRWRRDAGIADVQWATALGHSAQRWARHLQQHQNCQVMHSGTAGLGENIYWASPVHYSNGVTRPQDSTPASVTEAWVSEKQDYDYASNSCASGKMCGHYTQLVWKTTTHIGCARAVCGDYSQVWVCHYAPPGNWRGQRPF